MTERSVVVRGGGDLASGVIHRLCRCGYRVLILETEAPAAIRRRVSFCEAVYDGTAYVDGVCCRRIEDLRECPHVWERGEIPLLADPEGSCLKAFRPEALVDAIMAKRNLGTGRDMAGLTIALGPGFCAGEDVDYVVETMRGHSLGQIIREGRALPDTGVPGIICGFGKERVIHAPASGVIKNLSEIADPVEKGQKIACIGSVPVRASLTGVLRGLIRDGSTVHKGMKIADIDPRREERKNCFSISDKARCIAGSVVEILLSEGVMPYGKN